MFFVATEVWRVIKHGSKFTSEFFHKRAFPDHIPLMINAVVYVLDYDNNLTLTL